MADDIAPNEPYFNGIIYNPNYFNVSNAGATQNYVNSNFLQKVGNPVSTATTTTFTGYVTCSRFVTPEFLLQGAHPQITLQSSLTYGDTILTAGKGTFDVGVYCNNYYINDTNNVGPNGTNVMNFGKDISTSSAIIFNFNGAQITTNGAIVSTKNISGANIYTSGDVNITGTLISPSASISGTATIGRLGIHTYLPSYPLDVNGVINTNNNLYVSNQVGIGTTTPSYNLHVIGTAFVSGNFSTTGTITTSQDITVRNTLYAGMIGVNNPSPQYEIDVIGDVRASHNLYGTALGINLGGVLPLYSLDVNGTGHFNNDLLCDSNIICNSKIGINTTTPLYDLDINGFMRVCNGMFLTGGQFGIGTITPSYDVDFNVTIFRVTGVSLFDSSVGVKLGVGNTPNYDLEVNGTTFSSQIVSNSATVNTQLNVNRNSPNYTFNCGGQAFFTGEVGINGATPTGFFGVDISGSTRMSGSMITFGGISIGKTTLPVVPLDVSGVANITGNIVGGAMLQGHYTYLTGAGTSFYNTSLPQGIYTSWNSFSGLGGTEFINSRGGGSVGGFKFLDIASNAVNSQRTLMTINGNVGTNAGFVGINTSSPSYQLDVSGNINTNAKLICNTTSFSYSSLPTLSAGTLGYNTTANYASLPLTPASSSYYAITFTSLPIGVYMIQAYVIGTFITTTITNIRLGLSTASNTLTTNNLSQQILPVLSSTNVQSISYNYYLSNSASTTYYIVLATGASFGTSSITSFNASFIRIA